MRTLAPPNQRTRHLLGFACAFLVGVTLLSCPASADVLQLKSGGSIDGILLNPDESPRTKYVMRMEQGVEMTFAKSEVESHLPLSEALRLYRLNLSKMPATAEANWILAEWCNGKGLRTERELHLEATIQLDSDHEDARRALGYTRLRGEWKRREDFMRERGFVIHEGRWRLPQDVELDKQRREDDLASKRWTKDLKRWRRALGKNDPEVIASIQAIEDPRAAKALAAALANEKQLPVQRLYVSALAKLPTHVATKALVRVVLGAIPPRIREPDLDMRDIALDGLDRHGRDLAIDAFIHSLGDPDNPTVNRAAVGLQRLSDPRAIRPLIDALVTEHKYKLGADNPGQITTSFGGGPSGDGIGFGMGGGGPKEAKSLIRNRDVLDALLLLSDGFSPSNQNQDPYNRVPWMHWFATRDIPQVVDLRRDP